jgi:hypothetical protein
MKTTLNKEIERRELLIRRQQTTLATLILINKSNEKK